MHEKTVVCLKWGQRPYSNEWVNRLYRGVGRNLASPFNFVCFTDEYDGLDSAIDARDIAPLLFDGKVIGTHVKLALMHPLANLRGRCLFIDLDSAITGNLDDFFTLPDEFYMVWNWIERRKQIFRRRPQGGNSTTFLFDAGDKPHALEQYLADPEHARNRKLFTNPQAFLTHAVGRENITWLPEEWVRSFKRHCHPIYPLNLFVTPRIPKNCRIIAFHGKPNPDEVITGGGVWGHRKYIRPMPELSDYWR